MKNPEGLEGHRQIQFLVDAVACLGRQDLRRYWDHYWLLLSLQVELGNGGN